MSAPLMNMTEHVNVANGQEWINRLKLFLQAQGWTVIRHEENKNWVNTGGGVYDFDTGSEFFLEVTSNGYGSQNLHFRMRAYNATTTKYTFETWLGYGNTDLDTTIATHPVSRFKNPSNGTFVNSPFHRFGSLASSVPVGTSQRMWLFGFEQKYCCVVTQVTANKVIYHHFGTNQMEDANATWGAFSIGTNNLDWNSQVVSTPFDTIGFETFADYPNGDTKGGSFYNRLSFYMNNPHNDLPSAGPFNLAHLYYCSKNSHSSIRLMARPYLYVRDPADDIWFYIARAFWSRLSVVDYRIAERITYGTDEYICFPNFEVDLSKVGVAFRIA